MGRKKAKEVSTSSRIRRYGKSVSKKRRNYETDESPVKGKLRADESEDSSTGSDDGVSVEFRQRSAVKMGAGAKRRREVSSESDNESDEGFMADLLGASNVEVSSDEDVVRGPRKFVAKNGFGGRMKGGTHFRSNIAAALKELTKIPYKTRHLEVLRRTPFWLLFRGLKKTNLKRLREWCVKTEPEVLKIVKSFDAESKCFVVGDELLRLEKRDVVLTFGVCAGKTHIPLKGTGFAKPEWLSRCFGDTEKLKSIAKKPLRVAIKQLINSESVEDVEDVARLTHLYLLACVLAPNKMNSVAWYLAHFVADLDKICDYDWATYILEFLMECLVSTENQNCAGAVMLLPYWLCEHTTLVKPSRLRAFPRFLRWDLRLLYAVLRKLSVCSIPKKKVVSDPLQLTPKEKRIFAEIVSAIKALKRGKGKGNEIGKGLSRRKGKKKMDVVETDETETSGSESDELYKFDSQEFENLYGEPTQERVTKNVKCKVTGKDKGKGKRKETEVSTDDTGTNGSESEEFDNVYGDPTQPPVSDDDISGCTPLKNGGGNDIGESENEGSPVMPNSARGTLTPIKRLLKRHKGKLSADACGSCKRNRIEVDTVEGDTLPEPNVPVKETDAARSYAACEKSDSGKASELYSVNVEYGTLNGDEVGAADVVSLRRTGGLESDCRTPPVDVNKEYIVPKAANTGAAGGCLQIGWASNLREQHSPVLVDLVTPTAAHASGGEPVDMFNPRVKTTSVGEPLYVGRVLWNSTEVTPVAAGCEDMNDVIQVGEVPDRRATEVGVVGPDGCVIPTCIESNKVPPIVEVHEDLGTLEEDIVVPDSQPEYVGATKRDLDIPCFSLGFTQEAVETEGPNVSVSVNKVNELSTYRGTVGVTGALMPHVMALANVGMSHSEETDVMQRKIRDLEAALQVKDVIISNMRLELEDKASQSLLLEQKVTELRKGNLELEENMKILQASVEGAGSSSKDIIGKELVVSAGSNPVRFGSPSTDEKSSPDSASINVTMAPGFEMYSAHVVQQLQQENAHLREQLQYYVDPTPTQLFENPATLEKIECIELLHASSKIIQSLERDKMIADALTRRQEVQLQRKDAIIAQQRETVDSMQLMQLEDATGPTVDAVPLKMEMPDTGVAGTSKKNTTRNRGKGKVSPSSLAKRIKARTQCNNRVPKKSSPLCVARAPICLNDDSDDERPLLQLYSHGPFPKLKASKHGVKKTTSDVMTSLKEAWLRGGPMETMYECGEGMKGSVLLGMLLDAIQHECISNWFIDAWCEVVVRLYGKNANFVNSTITYPACLWGELRRSMDSNVLKAFVDNRMERALECDVLLFPLNPNTNRGCTKPHGNHWVLLKYDVSKDEWSYFNSLPPRAGIRDPYFPECKKMIIYVENAMRKVYAAKMSTHPIHSRGLGDVQAIKMDTWRQKPDSLDCGVIVCNLIELIVLKKETPGGTYSEEMAGSYRAKMVQWMVEVLDIDPEKWTDL